MIEYNILFKNKAAENPSIALLLSVLYKLMKADLLSEKALMKMRIT